MMRRTRPARYTHRALVKRSALARRYTRSAGKRLTSVIPAGSTATAAAWTGKAASGTAEHSQTCRASLLRTGVVTHQGQQGGGDAQPLLPLPAGQPRYQALQQQGR